MTSWVRGTNTHESRRHDPLLGKWWWAMEKSWFMPGAIQKVYTGIGGRSRQTIALYKQPLRHVRGPIFTWVCLSLSWTYTPANTRHWAIVGSMLGQRRRRWTNIELTMAQCLLLVGEKLQTWTHNYNNCKSQVYAAFFVFVCNINTRLRC